MGSLSPSMLRNNILRKLHKYLFLFASGINRLASSVEMLLFHLYLYILCSTLARSHPLGSIANELRDLATQKPVIMRTGMATVIKDFRDGIIATVERRSLIETTSELDGALEELLWSIYYFDGMNSDFSKYNNQSGLIAFIYV